MQWRTSTLNTCLPNNGRQSTNPTTAARIITRIAFSIKPVLLPAIPLRFNINQFNNVGRHLYHGNYVTLNLFTSVKTI